MTTLWTATARIAYLIRCIAIAYIAVQVFIWHSFYAAGPWRLAGPVTAAAWGSAMVAYLLHRRPGWRLACLDSGVQIALALSAGLWVPSAMRGDTANWVYILMAGQLVVPAWFAPLAVLVPLALASGLAYWAGAMLAPAAALAPVAGTGPSSPAAASVMLLAVAAAAWCGRWTLYRWAIKADSALARVDGESREQYVVLSRNIERREHERLLHDTVLNTLTALARGGGGDTAGVVGRCRHDVTLMEYVLSAPGGPAQAIGQSYGGLQAGIEAVANEMRARGLDVHVEVQERPAAALAVPPPVAVAMAHAVREALANVVSHSGTAEAWVEVSPAAPGGQAGEPACLEVTVRDAGRGFDLARVDPARLGLRRSIVERIADWGGQASVWSAPGEGTVVRLRWTAAGRRGQEAVAAAGRPDLPW
jgi:signal transduction histidine kinase